MGRLRDILHGKPKYAKVNSQQNEKAHVPEGAWTKCPQCGAIIYQKDLEQTLSLCEKCGFHFPVGARERIRQLIDAETGFTEFDGDLDSGNPLGFPAYAEKKEREAAKTGLHDAVVTGVAGIDGHAAVVGALDYGFIAGTMGSVVGEKIVRAFEYATQAGLPVVLVSSSGGARMQESIISLMQMQKTAAAVEAHSRAGLLFISVLAHPTLAGVFGSFASQGDIVLAEPGAMVGFAGPEVIRETTQKKVPPELQKAETVYRNGFIDVIVSRKNLKPLIGKLLAYHEISGYACGLRTS